MATKANPLKREEDIQKNPDPHIDQDYEGFPHLPANKKNITPKTATEKKVAGADKKKSKKSYGS